MDNQRKMLCERCKEFYPFSEIKYMPKGNGGRIALCSSCRRKADVDSKKKMSSSAVSKKDYFCGRCRYHFKHDPNSLTALRCPYCGKNDKVIDNVTSTTDKLLQEAEFEDC